MTRTILTIKKVIMVYIKKEPISKTRKEIVKEIKKNFPLAFEMYTENKLEEQHKGIVVVQYGVFGPDFYFHNANSKTFLEIAMDMRHRIVPQKKVFYSETFWWGGGKKLEPILDDQRVLNTFDCLKAIKKLEAKLNCQIADKGIKIFKIGRYDAPYRIYKTTNEDYLVVSLMNGAVVQMKELPRETKPMRKCFFVGAVNFFTPHANNFKRE